MASSTNVSDLPAGLTELTPEQRALLMLRMRRKAQAPAAAEEPPLARASRAEVEGGLPLSFSQARLWVVDQLQPGNPAYNIAVTVRLVGPLDEPALFAAFADLAERQESLRTVFRQGDAGPVQVISPPDPSPFSVVDLQALPENSREPELLRLAQDDAHKPFDLSGGELLLRLCLLRLSPTGSALSVNMHHIISDGWSIGIFVRELGAFYEERAAGIPSGLPELPVQYADFAVWQRRRLTGEVLDRQLAYWKETLAGAPTRTELPVSRPRPAVRTLAGGRHPYELPPALVQELRALSARSGATLFMAMLAGLTALLSRHSGETDLLIGSPVAGRNRAELEGLVGFFVNNLVLRCDLSGDPGFAELVGRARRTTVDAQAHQDLPFEKLVEELKLPRDLTRNPLFEVSLSMQSGGTAPLSLPGLSLSVVPVSPGTARQDLMLVAIETEAGGVLGYLEYSTDLFDPAAARRLIDRLETLLAAAVADPQKPLSALPLLSPGERWQLLGEWNDSARSFPGAGGATFPEVWADLVRLRPDAAAVSFGDASLSYSELDRRADLLALYLRTMGIGPEVPVGLALPRSLSLPVGILAIWKAAGVYVPLDPSYPEERLALYLEETGLLVLVTEEELLDTLPRFFGFTVALTRDWPMIETSAAGQALESTPAPGNLAYLIFTSGSTGRPKGVGIPHAGLVHLTEAVAATFGEAPGRRAAFFASIAFDASVFELAVAFFRGGTLDVVPRDEVPPGPTLERWMAEREVAAWTVTPSALAALPGGPLPGLADLIVAGEACPAELAARWATGRRFWNAYGPTEMTVWITTDRVDPEAGVAPPIGRPIPNGTVYAVDRGFHPVPPGALGELVAGSPGLARGYWNRPEVTAERFVPDPFGPEPGGRLYRTGDLVRFLPDGRLAFVGRNDQQVKVRGVRLEIGEVEAVLGQHPDLAEAAVVVAGEGLEARLVALYASRNGDLAAGELRRHLAERLPEAMVPASFVALPELPQTPNGKVDRKALAALAAGELTRPADGFAAPQTPEEELVAALMADVLGRERIGRGESFFERGGHSLLATRLVTRLQEVFEVEVPLTQIFEAPTVEGLAEAVLRRTGEAGEARRPIPRRPAGEAAPLSFSQQRLWFLQRLDPWSVSYNLPGGVRLRGEVSLPALAASLGEIVRRHEVLRSDFVETAGEPMQEVRPWEPPTLPEIDLSALPEDRREAGLVTGGESLARRPFDLAAGPLYRLAFFRSGPDDGALLFVLHHAVADGWSMGILVRELGELYRAALAGEPADLPSLPVQYADFAAWQREHLAGAELERQLAYWKARFSPLPAPLELPADRPRPATSSQRGDRRPFAARPEVSRNLAALARRQGATLFMALAAAWQVFLSRLTGADDVVIGTPIAGRGRREIEGLIGFFVNTLALRADLSGDPAFETFLARTRAAALGAYAHQDLPFERLVEEISPERSLAQTPLFQVMLSLESAAGGGGLELPGVALAPWGIERGAANFDLSFDLREAGGDLFGSLEYQLDLFDAATVDRWLLGFEALLAAVVDSPERRISEISLATESERHQLLAEWTDTPEAPGGATLPDLLTAQVAKTPDAVTVVAGEERLTFAELDRRATHLAARLRRLGVGPEVTVGLHLRRDSGLVVGVWGVLEAGGACVPLDPAWPRERRALVLGDSGAGIVLTDRAGEEEWAGWEGTVLGIEPSDRSEGPEPAGPARSAGERSLAYLIYTSGSTGRPKGVAIEHRSAVALASWVRRTFSPAELAGVLASTSIAFDMSVFELILAPALGGRAILAPNALALPELPARDEVTLINTVPSAVAELLRTGGLPPSVRTANVGGEPLPAALVEGLAERGIGRVVNLYGPSEDTTYSTWAEVGGTSPVPIGRPVDGTRVYLLSAAGVPVPFGAAGDLHLAGVGLARGYLGQPERTAERFLPDPFGGPGERLYRTSDLARHRADGTLDYLGRLDQQVKVRGLRIEPGEVEAALAAFPGVAQAVVLAVADSRGDRGLAAFVVPAEPEAPPSATDLFDFLRGRLPAGYVPSRFVFLAALPRLANGKIDRRTLTLPQGEAAPAAGTPPRGSVERALAALWGELLETAPIHREDHFFTRGGHSLLAARLIGRIRGDLGVELPLRAVFEAPTLATMARAIEAIRAAAEAGGAPPLVPRPDGEPVPLSFAQERLWFLDRLQPGTSTYNLVFAARLPEGATPRSLETALLTLVGRHETLRTRFPERDGRPEAEVLAVGVFPVLSRVDLSHLPAARAEETVREAADLEALRPFDLTTGPLFRAALFELPGSRGLAVLGLHHVIADGWSLGILARELSAAFTAARAGEAPALPELPVQYGDYAAWQREWLAGEALAERLGYWRRALAGAPPLVTLPPDRPRPAVQSLAGAALRHTLPEEAGLAAHELAREQEATPFMVLLAAFVALVARAAGEDDVVVGVPTAGRDRAEIEGLIGCFVNTLAVRVSVAGDPPGFVLVARVREALLGALAHQELPFEKLVAELVPERALSHTPLFQLMLQLQSAATGTLDLGSQVGLELQPLPAATSQFDLSISYEEGAGGALHGVYQYATALYDRTTIERTAERLPRLLAALAETPARRVSALPLLSAAEVQQVTVEWPAAGGERAGRLARGPLFAERFAEVAGRRPDAVAWMGDETSLTYGELEHRSGGLAHRLAGRGIGPESVVALLGARGLSYWTAALSVARAGAAWLPLDPAHPPARLARILERSGTGRLLAEPAALGLAGELAAPIPGLQVESWLPGSTGNPLALREVEAENLAYLFYTSGSTGEPKGVMVPQRAWLNHLLAKVEDLELGPDDTVAQTASHTFDISIWQAFAPLLAGGRARVFGSDTAADLVGLWAALAEEGVTVFENVPSVLAALVDEKGEPGGGGRPPLRLAVSTGEALPAALTRRWSARLPEIPLVNGYGPTECADRVSHHFLDGPEEGAAVPLGRPILGLYLAVLDSDLRPLPIGSTGELAISGTGVARGYRGDPARTAEAFVPDPASGVIAPAGSRIYRTGDLTRFRADGRIDYLGRRDHQVKLRGVRIEIGEIEAALATHGRVHQAAVEMRPLAGAPALVAYVVPTGGDLPAEELRAHLRARLPEAMIPASFVFLEALPRTPSGKLDRRALPDPAGLATPREPDSGPLTPLESHLAALWREVLEIPEGDPVGRWESFFSRGGDSLRGAVLINRLRRRLGADLPVAALFAAPALADLAAWIEEHHPEAASRWTGSGGPAADDTIPRLPPGTPVPLSLEQERIWFLHTLAPESAAYNLPAAFRLHGPLEVAALSRAVRQVVTRHQVLRSRIALDGGIPLSRVGPVPAEPLPVIDLSALPEPAAAARLLASAEAARPFDLERGEMVRAALFQLAPDDRALAFTFHHAAADGWSLGLWAREVETLYRGFAEGRPAELPPLPLQYGDFAAWQRTRLAGETLEREVAWWKERLAGAPASLDLPLDRRRPQAASLRGGAAYGALSPEVTALLKQLAHASGASLFMTLLAAFSTLLGRLAGQDDVVVGAPIAGRNRPELEGLIGCFINTLALRISLAPEHSFHDLLASTREQTLAAFAHQDVPFERLLEELQPARDLGRTPVFQVLLNLLNLPSPALDLPGLSLSGLELAEPPAKFDLTLYAQEAGDTLRFQLVYAADLFDAVRMEELLRQLTGLLGQIVEAPEAPLGRFSLLTPEAAAVLPDPRQPLDATYRGPVHEIFRERARLAPEHPAVLDRDGALTYGDLDDASDALAAEIARRGLGKGAVAAVLAHRSLPLPVAILGVLKTGAAYLVLDPREPASRLAEKIRLAGPRLLLTLPAAGPVPEALAGLGLETLEVPRGLPGERPAPFPSPATAPGDLACLSFTSGSIGEPKGVFQNHGSMSYFLPWFTERLGLTPADRFPLLTGLAHDPLQRDLFHSLCTGATLAIPDPDQIGAPGYLPGFLREHAITVAHFTPALAQLLCDSAEESDTGTLTRLRHVLFGGDALPRALVARVSRLAPDALFHNLYGTTESHRALAIATADAHVRPMDLPLFPLGQGIPGTQLLVLTPTHHQAGIGELGEIALRSPHLAAGYLKSPLDPGLREGEAAEELPRRTGEGEPLHRPALPHPSDATSEPARRGSSLGRQGGPPQRFLANPLGREGGTSSNPNDRLYLTGDLGRYRPDGQVETAGRADRQIKIRGFRIEPAEIEAALTRQPGVTGATVRPWTLDGQTALAAYVVAPPGLDLAALRLALRDQLPEALRPTWLLRLDRLPLNPNGKVDQQALPEPTAAATARRAEEPGDLLELRLLSIWEDVLGRPAGVGDDFFESGGHSLLAVRLLARIAEDLGRTLPVAALFTAATVRDLARLLREEGETEDTPLVRLRRGDPSRPLFLVHPIGGQVTPYLPLARELDWEGEIYGLQDSLPLGEPRTLSTLAEAYLREIRKAQPHGSYRLAGWSFGGRVAFEMARRLREAGEEVAFLGLLDTGYALPPERTGLDDAGVLSEVFPELSAGLAELPQGADVLEALLHRAWETGALPEGFSPEEARRRLDLLKAHLAIGPRDRPGIYPGKVHLFVASETWPEGGEDDPTHGWAGFAGNVEIHRMPGDHVSMMREPENRRELARRVDEAMMFDPGPPLPSRERGQG